MLPIHLNKKEDTLISYRESFAETLCDGYRFDIRGDIYKSGTRYVHYYKPGHSLIVSHTDSNKVHIIDLITGKLRCFEHHNTSVRCIITLDSTNEIVTGSWDATVCITNFDTLVQRLNLTEKTSMGRCPHVAISPDFKHVYSYTYDSDKNPECTSNTIRVWSLENGALENIIQLPGDHIGTRRCGSCVVLNNHIYSVSNSGFFQVFDCYSGKLEAEYFCDDELESICSIPSHDLIVFGCTSGYIFKYNISEQRITQSVKGHVHSVSQLMLSSGQPEVLLSVSFDGTLKIWAIADLKLIASVNVFRNYLWTLSTVNDLIVTGGDDGEIWIYDMKDLKNIILRGKILIFDQSFAFVPADQNSFYTDNQATMQVLKKENNEPVSGRFSEYLLNSRNTLKVLQDLFKTEKEDPASSCDENNLIFQIPQSFK